MSSPLVIDCGLRTVLAFRGPDALRYLNGQVTQDVRRVLESGDCLPACVTNAKGKIEFRVWLSPGGEGTILVDAPAGCAGPLEERLGKYLIADDVEIEDQSGKKRLWHVVGSGDGTGLPSARWGVPGADSWLAPKDSYRGEGKILVAGSGESEALRISRCVPSEDFEPVAGSFPAELGLDATDVSFHKGCYIGQEVISRIQTAKKVNRRLSRLDVADSVPLGDWALLASDGKEAGHVTSVSPIADEGRRLFLAMVKRGKEPAFLRCAGEDHPVRIRPVASSGRCA